MNSDKEKEIFEKTVKFIDKSAKLAEILIEHIDSLVPIVDSIFSNTNDEKTKKMNENAKNELKMLAQDLIKAKDLKVGQTVKCKLQIFEGMRTEHWVGDSGRTYVSVKSEIIWPPCDRTKAFHHAYEWYESKIFDRKIIVKNIIGNYAAIALKMSTRVDKKFHPLDSIKHVVLYYQNGKRFTDFPLETFQELWPDHLIKNTLTLSIQKTFFSDLSYKHLRPWELVQND